jgi:hypothetical protein
MLEYESPTALTTRPTVVIRQIPGKSIRIPARSGTLLLVALLLWGVGAIALPLPWYLLTLVVGLPAMVLALLVEWKPRGKPPLAWLMIILRHRQRANVVPHRPLAPPKWKG